MLICSQDSVLRFCALQTTFGENTKHKTEMEKKLLTARKPPLLSSSTGKYIKLCLTNIIRYVIINYWAIILNAQFLPEKHIQIDEISIFEANKEEDYVYFQFHLYSGNINLFFRQKKITVHAPQTLCSRLKCPCSDVNQVQQNTTACLELTVRDNLQPD